MVQNCQNHVAVSISSHQALVCAIQLWRTVNTKMTGVSEENNNTEIWCFAPPKQHGELQRGHITFLERNDFSISVWTAFGRGGVYQRRGLRFNQFSYRRRGGSVTARECLSLALSLSLSFLPLLSRLALEPTGDTLFSLNPASTELHTLDLITQTSGNVFQKQLRTSITQNLLLYFQVSRYGQLYIGDTCSMKHWHDMQHRAEQCIQYTHTEALSEHKSKYVETLESETDDSHFLPSPGANS